MGMVSNKEMLYHHCFSTLLWRCYLDGQVTQGGSKLNCMHQLLDYVDDVYIMGRSAYYKGKHRIFS
jgi:hypothetical protein